MSDQALPQLKYDSAGLIPGHGIAPLEDLERAQRIERRGEPLQPILPPLELHLHTPAQAVRRALQALVPNLGLPAQPAG